LIPSGAQTGGFVAADHCKERGGEGWRLFSFLLSLSARARPIRTDQDRSGLTAWRSRRSWVFACSLGLACTGYELDAATRRRHDDVVRLWATWRCDGGERGGRARGDAAEERLGGCDAWAGGEGGAGIIRAASREQDGGGAGVAQLDRRV